MSDIDTQDMISARNEQKSASSVECQSSEIRAADIPLRDNLVCSYINREGRPGVFDVRVKKTASIINRVAFR